MTEIIINDISELVDITSQEDISLLHMDRQIARGLALQELLTAVYENYYDKVSIFPFIRFEVKPNGNFIWTYKK